MTKRLKKPAGKSRGKSGRSQPAGVPSERGPLCGAKLRKKDRTCTQRAGHKTDHPGIGRCWLHGGRAKRKHGLYSEVLAEHNRELIDQLAAAPDLVSLHHEIALARAALVEFAALTKQASETTRAAAADPSPAGLSVTPEAAAPGSTGPSAMVPALSPAASRAMETERQVSRLGAMFELLEAISRMVKRQADIQFQGSFKLTDAQLRALAQGVQAVLAKHMRDQSLRQAILADLAALFALPGGDAAGSGGDE